MRNAAKIWAVVLGISATTVAGAQNISDPTYSIHNYKHPNKAAKMKAIAEAKPEIYVEQSNQGQAREENNLTASANYKGMSAGKSNIREFRVSNAPEARPFILGNTNANYKQQFPTRTKRTAVPVEKEENGVVAVD